ncbi:MAG: CDP-glycerol glycerophosphotransferase family protein [Clostridia bacterium]
MGVKVSVIVSICDGKNCLENTLNTIKSQTLKDIQVILVNAGGTEETEQIMKDACIDSRFEYYHIDDQSVSNGRNFAMEKSTGKYIAFADENVLFSKDYLESMYNYAQKEKADLCICKMTSSDAYGEHEFDSSKKLIRNKTVSQFDMNIVWNPAVTNKLFLREKIMSHGFKFHLYGKGREVAFTLPYAFEASKIVCPKKGLVTYITPVSSKKSTHFKINYYLDAYAYVRAKAVKAFDVQIENSQSEFDTYELIREKNCYIDEIYTKEITVLLYSYYRHFWQLTDEQIQKFTDIIRKLYDNLSKSAKSSVKKRNSDIFFDNDLIDNRLEMVQKAKITVCVGKSDKFKEISKEKFAVQINAIFEQTMPCFTLFVDSRYKEIFPEKWLDMPNLKFIEAETLTEFKEKALEQCQTVYIMYQDFYTILSSKLLMYHYLSIHGQSRVAFTTSPISRYINNQVKRYTFSKLSFKYNRKSTHTHKDDMHALDLFFCNKLFRVSHLQGIYFTFSDNSILDMYKIYDNAKFKKLTCSGVYFAHQEDRVMSIFKGEQKFLPEDCRKLYKKYKRIYFIRYSVKTRVEKFWNRHRFISAYFISFFNSFFTSHYGKKKIKNRVFIYSNRSDNFIENLANIDAEFTGDKVTFCKKFPHTLRDKRKIKKYLLTSKVIVIDDNMKYLRRERLRPEQKVVQAWYCGGAFKRFGLDAPLTIRRIEEYKSHSQYSDVCVSSDYVRQFFAHAFALDIEKIKAVGTPRTDDILNEKLREKNKKFMIEKHPLLKDKKVYVYFPTFREVDGEVANFDPKIDWDELNDELEDDEIFLICRHHMMQDQYLLGGPFYSRVKDYSFESIQELLSVADVVVTDYSAIIFDASLLNLPMVFYCPDFETYERDFYLDYEKDLPGEIIKESAELLTTMRNAKDEKNSHLIKEFKKREMGACDGNSTKRVVEIINGYLN